MVVNKERFMHLFLIFVLLAPFVSPKSTNAEVFFSDVTLYSDQINFLYENGIIKGYNDGTFRPFTPIKRLQAVQMILRELGIESGDAPDVYFTDLKPGAYGYEEVAQAVELGIVTGKADGSFDPAGYLTRAQMATIMNNAYYLMGDDLTYFNDISDQFWAKEAINALAANGITTGYDDQTFRPNANITRAHFSVFMTRYIKMSLLEESTDQLKTVISNEHSVVMIEGFDQQGDPIQQGSGFFVGKGLILTNYHVLEGAYSYEVIAEDGQRYPVEGVAEYDSVLDLAVLKTSSPVDIEPLKLGSIDMVQKGDPVVTIGSPYGLINTVSEGIVSGLRVLEDQGEEISVIQITAPITSGSSGGPLFNMKGYVLGINSFGFETGNLNFAVAIDYAKPWISELNNTPFNEIDVVANVGQPGEITPNPEEDNVPTPGTGEAVETTILSLPHPIYNVIHEPGSSVIYGIGNERDVIKIDYQTQQMEQVYFEEIPGSIFLSEGELFVGLQTREHSSYWWREEQSGYIASIDAASFSLKNKYEIDIDPYDIVADNSHVYVSSGSGQWTFFNSYHRDSGNLGSSTSIRQQSYLQMDPNFSQIYTIDTDISPRGLEVFSISNGSINGSYESPYHGDYSMNVYNRISPDGNYLFNGSGNVFYATDRKETNMTWAGELHSDFTEIAFDISHNRFFTVEDHQLHVYDYSTFELIDTYVLKNNIQKLFIHNNQLIAVAVTGGAKPTFIIEEVDLP